MTRDVLVVIGAGHSVTAQHVDVSPRESVNLLAREEMSGPGAEGYQRMIQSSPAGRA